MPRVIRYPEQREETYYLMEYIRRDAPGCGFSFPCDAAGVVDEAALPEPARESLAHCRAQPALFNGPSIQRYTTWYVEAGLLRCDCGASVDMPGHGRDCACDVCGTEYNASGSRLEPRVLWAGYDVDGY